MKTEELIIKVKKTHPDAVIPTYAKPGDAGMDLKAVSLTYTGNGDLYYGTGLCFEIPAGYVGLLYPRSSICRTDLSLTNSVGVVDAGYRGEVSMVFRPMLSDVTYKIGDRIGQLIIIPYPKVSFQEVDELSVTERGQGGYGSTGN